jgi:hypothetical protein
MVRKVDLPLVGTVMQDSVAEQVDHLDTLVLQVQVVAVEQPQYYIRIAI